jgi:hypothetical protein
MVFVCLNIDVRPRRKRANESTTAQNDVRKLPKEEHFSERDNGFGLQVGSDLFRVGCQMFTAHSMIKHSTRMATGTFPPIPNFWSDCLIPRH